jgi:hypothetical protein
MKNEVRFVDGGGQPVHELYSRAQSAQPDEIVMAAEEFDEADERRMCLGEVIDFLFCDGRPMQWGYALRRLVGLVSYFCPSAGAGMLRLAEALGLAPIVRGWGMAELETLRDDPERVRGLVLWLLGGSMDGLTARVVKDGMARVYFLALGVRPELLRRDGKQMTLEDFAEAFGESRDGARQRWSWRGGKLLEGLPQMEWQRGPEAREKARVNAERIWRERKKASDQ